MDNEGHARPGADAGSLEQRNDVGLPGTVPSAAPGPAQNQSLPQLLKQLQGDVAELVNMEKALAKKELSFKAAELKREGLQLGSAGVISGLGAACLVAAATLALATVLAAWLAALIMGAALIALGAVLALRFRSNIKHFDMVPRHTVREVGRNVHAIKEAAR
jgi:inactivated superfamily I helicase